MTRTTNLTGSGAQTIIFEEPQYFSFLVNDYNNNQFISQQLTFSSPSQHLLGILLSLLPFTRNLPFLNLPNSFTALSGNNWYVGCSCYPASSCYSLDVCCLQTLENLSIRFRHSTKYKLYFMRSIFIDVDGNDRGQTSCPVVWAEMQTDKM